MLIHVLKDWHTILDYSGIPSARKLLRDHLVYRCVSKTGTTYMTAKDVKSNKSIIRVNLPDDLDEKVIDELVDKNASFKRNKKYILNHWRDVCWEFVPTITEKGIRERSSD
jgi:hypothetical protein